MSRQDHDVCCRDTDGFPTADRRVQPGLALESSAPSSRSQGLPNCSNRKALFLNVLQSIEASRRNPVGKINSEARILHKDHPQRWDPMIRPRQLRSGRWQRAGQSIRQPSRVFGFSVHGKLLEGKIGREHTGRLWQDGPFFLTSFPQLRMGLPRSSEILQA